MDDPLNYRRTETVQYNIWAFCFKREREGRYRNLSQDDEKSFSLNCDFHFDATRSHALCVSHRVGECLAWGGCFTDKSHHVILFIIFGRVFYVAMMQ